MANTITTLLKLDATQLKTGFRQAQQSIRETDGLVAKAKAGFSGMWASFTSSPLAIAGATAAVGAFTAKAVNDASNLEESINAVNVAYQDSADGVHALGQTSADAFGLSQRAFNEFSVQFSAFADKIATAGGRDVTGVLDEMTTRIADFASVNNLDMAEAAQIFQSSLAGETEALRRFGGDVSAAAVEQFAFENGLIKTKAELTESIKVQARYGLLMKETAKTQGDFANTSDSLANQQRILSANVEDLSASFGKKLTPILADAAGSVNNLISAYDDLVSRAPGGTGGPVGGFISGLVNPLTALKGALDGVERATGFVDDALGDEDKQLVENIKNWREAAEQADTWHSSHVSVAEQAGLTADQLGILAGQSDRYVESLVQSHDAAEQAAEDAAEIAEWDARAAENAERRQAAHEAVAEAMERQLSAGLQLIGGDIAVREAQRRATESADDLNEVLADQETTIGDAAEAIDTAADAHLNAANQAANYRQQQLEANGQTVDAKVQAQLFEEELRRVAETTDGPLRAALDAYIEKLDHLDGRTVTTNIVLNTPGRVGDFATPEVGGVAPLVPNTGGNRVTNVYITTTGVLAPQAVVDAINKYDRINSPR